MTRFSAKAELGDTYVLSNVCLSKARKITASDIQQDGDANGVSVLAMHSKPQLVLGPRRGQYCDEGLEIGGFV